MRIKPTIIVLIQLFVLALATLAFGQAQPSKPTQYMTQSYVDTTVMRAILILNEASSHYSAANNRQNIAVQKSRQVLEDLKKKAKGDPNERYALMKIQEVEAQIYLEEEEMRKIAEDKRILSANQLVFQYNAEVGKLRPDFATLRSIHMRMMDIDRRQANNLAVSYNRRYQQISREAQYSLEKALTSKDLFIAREELEYCERNKFYLLINPAHLARQRERFEKLQSSESSAQSAMVNIKRALDDGEAAMGASRLSESRTKFMMAQDMINESRPSMPAKEGTELAVRCARLIKALDTREDSLVRAAIDVLEKQGPDAAYAFLQEVLHKRHNISNERAAFVDQAIMNRTPQRGIEIDEKNRVEMIDAPMAEATSKELELFASMQNKARFRAQERADSVRAANDVGMKIYAMLEEGRLKDAREEFGRQEQFLIAAMPPSALEMLRMSITHAASAPKGGDKKRAKLAKKEAKAAARQAKIDKKNAEKQAKIDKKEQARLAKLERKGKGKAPVEIAATSATSSTAASVPAAASVPVADAHAQSQFALMSRSTQSATLPAQSLTQPPAAGAPAAAGGAQPPTAGAQPSAAGAPAAGGDPNRQMAYDVSVKIYALVEQDNIIEAHERFQKYKGPLQKYMSPEEYQMLEFMVVQSYKYVTQQ